MALILNLTTIVCDYFGFWTLDLRGGPLFELSGNSDAIKRPAYSQLIYLELNKTGHNQFFQTLVRVPFKKFFPFTEFPSRTLICTLLGRAPNCHTLSRLGSKRVRRSQGVDGPCGGWTPDLASVLV